MTFIDPAPLEGVITSLLEQMTDNMKAPDNAQDVVKLLERSERLAKAISVHVKAVQDITAHNARYVAQEDEDIYLNYDDLPPPNPEDRARFIKRLKHLYACLNAEGTVPNPD